MRRIFVLLLLLALAAPASAFPLLPAEFSGTVTIDGSPAPAGTVIIARIDGRDCGSLTLAAGVFGGEELHDTRLIVNGEDGDAGKTITFFVDGVAAGTAVYTPGASTTIALAVTTGTASGGSSGSSGGGSGSGSGPSATPTPAATVAEPTGADEEGANRQDTPAPAATTAPLTEPTLTFGAVASATAVQYAGLPSSWLAGLVALAGATLLVGIRKRG